MKPKRTLALLLCAALLLTALSACGATVVVVEGGGNAGTPTGAPDPAGEPGPTQEPEPTQEPDGQPGGETTAVKTGLAVLPSLSASASASGEGDGAAQADILLVAVTVDDDGVIDSCIIDSIQAKIGFNAQGALTTPLDTTFATKLELGDDYGMRAASPIGKEWNEQANALAGYVAGKTVDELKGIALDDSGHAVDEPDLTASVIIGISDLLEGVEAAVANAAHLGASKGDKLGLAAETNMASSKDASSEEEGLAQAYATFAVTTTGGGVITSCLIDALQANVSFDTAGQITTDLASVPKTKNQLGDDYGMVAASSIGKEWYEQAAGFCQYVTGKSADDVAGLAVNGEGKAADADLAAAVTLSLGDFQAVVEKAAK